MKYKELFEAKIDDLEFDVINPRLPKKLQHKSDKEVVEWMLLDASLIDLIASIGINGFFPGEPLLVVENKTNGKFTVVEGNRRLASCKILKNPELANVKQKTIKNLISEINTDNIPVEVPVFLFENRKDILQYLGYRHVTGVKSWGSLPKAKYLFELFSMDKSDGDLQTKCRELAKKIGSRGDYVLRLLTSYELFEKFEKENFYGIKNISEENIEFSNLVDAATRFSHISNFLNIDFEDEEPLNDIDEDNFKELVTWLFARDENGRTRIGENRNIKYLNSIVSSKKALSSFREGSSISEALLLTEEPDNIFTTSINNAIKNLENVLEALPNVSSYTLESYTEKILFLKSLIKNIKKRID